MVMWEELIQKAMEQLEYSYAPYSDFKVGAALLAADGRIFTGCGKCRVYAIELCGADCFF